MKSIVLIILLVTIGLHAQTWHGVVNLTVSGDERCQTQAESYLKRELRSLGDITISPSSPDWNIDAVVYSTTLTTGQRAGYNISVVISTPFCPNLSNYFSLTNEPAILVCTNYVAIQFHGMRGGSDLRKLCADIVTDFDTTQLESSRKSFEQIRQAMKSKTTNNIVK